MGREMVPVVGEAAVRRGVGHAFILLSGTVAEQMRGMNLQCPEDCDSVDFEKGVNMFMAATMRAIRESHERLQMYTDTNLPGL